MFADLSAFRRDPLGFMREKGNNSGNEPLVRLALGPNPIYLVASPEWVKPILNRSEEEIYKGAFIRKLRPAFGESFLLLTGDEHKRRRGVVHAKLGRSTVLEQVPAMAASIRQLAGSLAREESFDAHKITGPLTLRLISIALFGHQVLSPADEMALLRAVNLIEYELDQDMFRVIPRGPRAWLRRRRKYAEAHKIMELVVRRVRANAGQGSVLGSLEELGLSDSDIRDEILTMLLAGHHTTASAAVWLLYYLTTEPGLADRIAQECMAITDGGGDIVAADLKNAPLSMALAREVLRLYPSAWWFSRETKKPVEIAGHKLKKGTSLLFCPWQLQRHPDYWDDPDNFRLDRSFNNKSYIPFGVGPRTCVGMGVALLELQLLALEFASAYSMSLVSEMPAPAPKVSVTLIPPPIELRLSIRENFQFGEAAA
ncbi:cytochrome P450 [Methyloligella sp. 2.7D]|uniref:cytochrome P450 n=1 Tax=unclassified Methyloligella TaxID=2625955 RepID=UPI00157D9626|nr:cytochrome P450 [Methyloligella sp. GL2]QKP76134.1 cytochrome P450 [Methyloligella sp. GL2]